MHRTIGIALGTVIGVAFCVATPAYAADVFSDTLCPRASGPVTAYTTLAKNDNSTVDAVIAAASDAIKAYELCEREDQAGGAVEGRHYTQVRQAQFYFAIGHLQRLAGANDDASKALQRAIDLTKEPIEWTNSAQNIYQSNNVNVGSGSTRGGAIQPSIYHDTGIAIRTAAKTELEKLAVPTTPIPGTSPAPAAGPRKPT